MFVGRRLRRRRGARRAPRHGARRAPLLPGAFAASRSAGCSSTRRRRSSRRFRAASASTRPAGSSKRGIEIHVGTTLESYDGVEAVLANGTRVPARTLVWTAGVRANPLLGELGLPLDERGRVVVDATLRVEGTDDIWALGDGAAVINCKTPGTVDPPTCQHALRQARRLAKNLAGDPRAVRLPHARPGRDARPLQGHRGDPRPPSVGLPRAGSSRGRTTCTSSRSSPGSCASSSTGRWRCSSAATSSSCRCSATRGGSAIRVGGTVATFALIHGGGGSAWDWHLVVPQLRQRGHDPVAVDLPCEDESAGWREYADVVVEALGDRQNVVVVGHSLGGFTAPLVCARNTVRPSRPRGRHDPGPRRAVRRLVERTPATRPAATTTSSTTTSRLRSRRKRSGESGTRASKALREPWPLEAWPDTPTTYLLVPRRPHVHGRVGPPART